MSSNQSSRQRSWWGWGWADMAYTDEQCAGFQRVFPSLPDRPKAIPNLNDLQLRSPRVSPPGSLANMFSSHIYDRAGHTYGKAYRDVVRSLAGELPNPPDLVAFPETEAQVSAILDWATSNDVVVIPYGGGSSVVGGIEYREDDRPFISLDLTRLNRVLDIDAVSLAARIQGGALGPMLEDQLRPHGFTLRHFPQSFEFSTLGGWLATRSGGHYATARTHIDDFVESIRTVTPTGVMESWRLPGSGAGPSPDRLMLGSEGILGVVTEAWMRITPRPKFKESTSATFARRTDAFEAVRAISQSGLNPANCRLLSPGEAGSAGAGDEPRWVLVLGAESAFVPVDNTMAHLVEMVRDHGGEPAAPPAKRDSTRGSHKSDETAEAWRSSFLAMPYGRDAMARMSVLVETFETATTWDRIDSLYDDVTIKLGEVVTEVTGEPGRINCRFTHVYPDGPAPYFTVVGAGRPGSEVAMWDEIKAGAMEILTEHRATVSHHHAVGRDHRGGYDRQRPELFAGVLRAAKDVLDPAGILNPGVLID